MRIARILAFLLALVTLAVSYYYWQQMPYAFMIFIPANVGAWGSLLFWIKAPARKKARRRAAMASLAVVPFILGTAVAAYFRSPIQCWQVFVALSVLALIIAFWAIIRVKHKASHPWADYYRQVV